MVFHGTDFNMKWVLGFKSADAFAKNYANQGLWPTLSDSDRRKRLIEFFKLATNADDQRPAPSVKEDKGKGVASASAGENGKGSGIGSATAAH